MGHTVSVKEERNFLHKGYKNASDKNMADRYQEMPTVYTPRKPASRRGIRSKRSSGSLCTNSAMVRSCITEYTM